jgi:flagellar hook protein FlgE
LVTGTPAVPYASASVTGSVVNDQEATPVPITAATALSGAAGTDSLTSGFSAGDTITVDGTVLTFVASGATGNQLNVTDTVGTLLSKIQSITGVAPNISGGAITLNSGTAANLSVTSSDSSAFTALGFTGTVTAARTGGGTVGTGTVIGNDSTTFVNESISGGAVTAYNSAGTPINVQLRWALTSSSGGGSTWNLFYQTDPSATGTQAAWVNVGTNFTFGSSGALTSPTSGTISIPNLTVSNQSLGAVSLSVGSSGLTQYASTGGTATINNRTQNGYAAGQLQSLAVNNNGIVVGTFSNGQNIDLAAVTLSHFNGTNYLQALDGGAYAATEQSGAAIAGASGTISGSSLEGIHQTDCDPAGLLRQHQGHHHGKRHGSGFAERSAVTLDAA